MTVVDTHAARRCLTPDREKADALIFHVNSRLTKAVQRISELENENEELRRQVELLRRREIG